MAKEKEKIKQELCFVPENCSERTVHTNTLGWTQTARDDMFMQSIWTTFVQKKNR